MKQRCMCTAWFLAVCFLGVGSAWGQEIDSYDYDLPDLLEAERVQLHLPLGKGVFNDTTNPDRFFDIVEDIKTSDIKTFTRHAKSMAHGPTWPTQIVSGTNVYNRNNPPKRRDYYADFIRNIPLVSCTNGGHEDHDPLFVDKIAADSTLPPTNCRDLVLRNDLRAKDPHRNLNMIAYYWIGADEPMRGFRPEYSSIEPLPENSALQNCEPLLPGGEMRCDSEAGSPPTPPYFVNGVEMQAVDAQQPKTSRPGIAHRMSLETDYRNVVIQRMRELADRDVSAVFFDNFHGSPNGDWRVYEMDPEEIDPDLLPMPAAKYLNDSSYRALLKRFNRNNIELVDEILQEARAPELNPEFTAVVSVTYLPSLFDPRSRTSLAARVPSAKTEFHLPNRQVEFYHRRYLCKGQGTACAEDEPAACDRQLPAPSDLLDFGYALVRDASYGRPHHVWVYNPARNDESIWDDDLVLSSQQVESAASFVVGSGGIANLHPPGADPLHPSYQDAIHLKDTGRNMSGYRPYQWIAVHYSEERRDKIYQDVADEFGQATSDAEDECYKKEAYRKAWDDVLYPTIRSYLTFRRRGMPVNLITDGQVKAGQFADYQYIIVPSSDIEPELKSQLDSSGKTVIYLDDPGYPNPIRINGFKEQDLLARADFLSEAPLRSYFSDQFRVSFFVNAEGKVLANIFQNINWLLSVCGDDMDCVDEKYLHQISPGDFTILVNSNTFANPTVTSPTGESLVEYQGQSFRKLDISGVESIGQILIE